MARGVHPKIVAEQLGHSQISITLDTYSHVLPELMAGPRGRDGAVYGAARSGLGRQPGKENAEIVEPKVGFEPTTVGLRNRCSTPELLRRVREGRF